MSDTDNLYSDGPGRFATARKGGIDVAEIEIIRAKAAKGLTASQIAKQLGRPVLDVAPWMREPEVERTTYTQPGPEPAPAAPKITEPMVMLSLWRGLIVVNPPAQTRDEIAREVAERYRVPLEDLRGPGRAQYLVIPRQEAMWRMYQVKRWSNQQIANYFNGRDHTTVIHARKAHEKRMAEAIAYQATIDAEPSADVRAWLSMGQAA